MCGCPPLHAQLALPCSHIARTRPEFLSSSSFGCGPCVAVPTPQPKDAPRTLWVRAVDGPTDLTAAGSSPVGSVLLGSSTRCCARSCLYIDRGPSAPLGPRAAFARDRDAPTCDTSKSRRHGGGAARGIARRLASARRTACLEDAAGAGGVSAVPATRTISAGAPSAPSWIRIRSKGPPT